MTRRLWYPRDWEQAGLEGKIINFLSDVEYITAASVIAKDATIDEIWEVGDEYIKAHEEVISKEVAKSHDVILIDLKPGAGKTTGLIKHIKAQEDAGIKYSNDYCCPLLIRD